MTEVSASSRPTREEALAVALRGGEPPYLEAIRQAALAAYREAPWPSSARDEDWRRTAQVDRLDPATFAGPPPTPSEGVPAYLAEAVAGPLKASEALATLGDDESGDLPLGSEQAPLAVGLGAGLRGELALWQDFLGRVVPPGLRKWTALNTGRALGGACIHVPRGEQPVGPVRLLHGVSRASASFPRTLVKLEDGAQLTLIEEWLSPAQDPCLLVPVTEIELGRDAHLTHVLLQRCGDQTVLQSTVRVHQGEASSYDVRWAMLGASWQKSYFETFMLGEASQAKLVGLDIGRGRQHCDVQTTQDHVAPGAVSDLLYRVAVADRARSVYAGLIRVEEKAQKTNAYVQNRNLLLSPQAKADSNPTLEILANDVRCTHGSTAGRIDENQLFYCASRGMERQQARRLITEGFFADVVDAFPEGAVREHVRELVLGALAELASSGQPSPGGRSA